MLDIAETRHNIGCWVIERAAARWSIRLSRKGAAQRGSGRAGSKLVELASTLDWMNITGPPLKGLLRELDLTPEDLVVVHDDLDLEPGRLRIRHNGGERRTQRRQISDRSFGDAAVRAAQDRHRSSGPQARLRGLCVGARVTDEMAVYEPCLERAVDALELLLNRDLATAMNQFNVRDKNDGEAQTS